MHELAHEIWRLEKIITLGQAAAVAPLLPLDSMGQALLEFVRDTPAVYPAQIAKRLAVSRAAITKRLRPLVDKGYLALTPDDQDRRRVMVDLTELGHSVLERHESLRSANAAQYVREWESHDAETLVALMRRLNDRIDLLHHRDTPGWELVGK